VFPEDLEILRRFDAKGMELTGYPWAGDTYFVYANRGRGGQPPPANAQGTPLFGHGPDFGYLYYGAIWYGDEIWNGGRLKDADANKDGTTEDMELLTWLDANRPGKNDFQPWTKTTHPTLGAVEVGGWNPKFWSQNPPPEMLETWAKNEAMFNVFLAQQLAQVKVVSATSKASADGVFDVTMTVTNDGLIPTALEIAKRVKIVRPDTASIQLSAGQTFVAAAAPAGRVGGGGRGGGRGNAPAGPPRAANELGWLKPGEQKTVTWQVRGAGTVTVEIASTRGGVDRRTVDVK
jgi:hypothetical protein